MKKDWLDTKEYPFQSKYFEINGQKLHYIDEGVGEPIVFVHGTPSWSFEFRHLIRHLRQQYRCIAIDHIGFGLSDKPRIYDYSTQNHCSTLERFLLAKELRNIALVLHDFGGPIGLHFAIAYPEKVKRLILLNTWLWSHEQDPGFARQRKLLNSPLLPFLYRYCNFSPKYLFPRSFGNKKPNSDVLRHYTRPFSRPSERNGTLSFARSVLKDQDWFESLWEARSRFTDKPTLLIWGMKDPFVTQQHLQKFQDNLIEVKTFTLDEAGHYPHEEEPGAVTQIVADWLRSYT